MAYLHPDVPVLIGGDGAGPRRSPVRWRPGAGCVIIGVLAPVALVVTCVVVIVLLLVGQQGGHYRKVPADARPAGFEQVSRWQSCSATGVHCSDNVVFGGNGTSFEDAARDVTGRYEEKGWIITVRPADPFDDGGMRMSNRAHRTCITLSRFNVNKYHRDLRAPDATTMRALVEPYTTIIAVAAFECA